MKVSVRSQKVKSTCADSLVTEKGERGVLSRLTPLGVVGHGSAATALVPKFKGADDSKDLPLGAGRYGIPLGLGNEVGRRVRLPTQSLGPREDEVRLDAVSDEGKHW